MHIYDLLIYGGILIVALGFLGLVFLYWIWRGYGRKVDPQYVHRVLETPVPGRGAADGSA